MLIHLGVDPLATPASRASIVRAQVGPHAWRAALAAPTLPQRAAVLLEAIVRRAAADEADTDTRRTERLATPRRKAA